MRPAHHLLDIYSVWLHLATDRRAWATIRREVPSLAAASSMTSNGYTSRDETDDGRIHISIYIDHARHVGAGDLAALALAETIAHEACHAAGFILDAVGQRQRAADEARAYLVGWIAGWVHEHLPERNHQ